MTLDSDFWQGEREKLSAILLPYLSRLAQIGAGIAAQRIDVDPKPGNKVAAAWARKYTDDLLELLGSTSERVVGDTVAEWIETPGATNQDLIDRLTPKLGDNKYRAQLIAQTETTRAYAEGNAIVYQQAGLGIVVFKPPAHPNCMCWDAPTRMPDGTMVVAWRTNRSEIVCNVPIDTPWGIILGCGGLNGMVISEGDYLGQRI